jgi:hypothetical protein
VNFANFYYRTSDTGLTNPVPSGSTFDFPDTGTTSTGTTITRTASDSFQLGPIGAYSVSYQVTVDLGGDSTVSTNVVAGEIQLFTSTDGGATFTAVPNSLIGASNTRTTAGTTASATEITGHVLLRTTVANTLLFVANVTTNSLTLSTLAGQQALSGNLVINQLQ